MVGDLEFNEVARRTHRRSSSEDSPTDETHEYPETNSPETKSHKLGRSSSSSSSSMVCCDEWSFSLTDELSSFEKKKSPESFAFCARSFSRSVERCVA